MSGSDTALLEEVQRCALRFFWDFAHPVSFLARDRSHGENDPGDDKAATGGSGMGIMAVIVGVSRGWIDRGDAVWRLNRTVRFLLDADRFHGMVPHFLNGDSGRTIPFSALDDGADLVETAFLVQGLLAARTFFDGPGDEATLRQAIDRFCADVDWAWHTKSGERVLYWHWSPVHGWAMNHRVRGWNECLIAYVLAAGAASHAIDPAVYHEGFARGSEFLNGREYEGVTLPLGPPGGGPLFFSHYSFLGLDPRGLSDRYARYFEQNLAQSRINHAYCLRNPHGFKGYGPDCWGLTASDDDRGYDAHSPTNDTGVISPTAALSSYPYVPDLALAALHGFHDRLGDRIWKRFGPTDAFNETAGWYAATTLAIDQAPIVVMIENGRTGLLWDLVMSAPEVQRGLRRLDFEMTGPTA